TAGAGAAGWRRHLAPDWRLAGVRPLQVRFPDARDLEPGHRTVRRTRGDLWHARHFVSVAAARHTGELRHRDLSHRAGAGVAQAPRRGRDRAARSRAEYHLWDLGSVRAGADPAAARAAMAD